MQRVQPADVRTYADIPLRAPAAGASDIKELRADMEVRNDAPPATPGEAQASPERGTISPFKAVFLFSALWLAALAAYAVGVLGTEGASNLSPEWLFGVAAIAIVPVALALFAAWRRPAPSRARSRAASRDSAPPAPPGCGRTGQERALS